MPSVTQLATALFFRDEYLVISRRICLAGILQSRAYHSDSWLSVRQLVIGCVGLAFVDYAVRLHVEPSVSQLVVGPPMVANFQFSAQSVR